MSLYSRLDRLAADVEKLNRQVTAVANSPQSQRTSVEGGSIDFNDADGNLMAIMGGQDDGSNTIRHVDGPTPPVPSGLSAHVDGPIVQVSWDGTFEGGVSATWDWSHLEVVVVGPSNEQLTATINDITGASTSVAATVSGEWTVVARSVSRAEKRSLDGDAGTVTVELVGLSGAIEDAIGSANGKNTVTYSETAPTPADEGIDGDTWFVNTFDVETSIMLITEQWQFLAGVWVQTELDHQVIATIDAGKITVGELDGIRIAANSVRGEQLSGDAIDGKVITGGTYRTSGGNGSWSDDGLFIAKPDGTSMVRFPTDGSPLSLTASDTQIERASIGDLDFSNGAVRSGGEFTLASGVTAPASPPELTTGWHKVASLQTPDSALTYDWLGLGYWAEGSGHWVRAVNVLGSEGDGYDRIEVYDYATGDFQKSISITLNPRAGVTVIGDVAYVLGPNHEVNSFSPQYVDGYDLNTGVKVSYWGFTRFATNAGGRLAIGNDGTNVVVAGITKSNNLYVMRYDPTTGAQVGGEPNPPSDPLGGDWMATGWTGGRDLLGVHISGSEVTIHPLQETRVYTASGSTLTRKLDSANANGFAGWVNPNRNGAGMVWIGSTANVVDGAGNVYHGSGFHSDTNMETCYTWFDGTNETTPSPIATVKLPAMNVVSASLTKRTNLQKRLYTREQGGQWRVTEVDANTTIVTLGRDSGALIPGTGGRSNLAQNPGMGSLRAQLGEGDMPSGGGSVLSLSTQWATSGSTSLAISSASNRWSSAYITPGHARGTSLPVAPGGTATIAADFHLPQKQTGNINAEARRLVVGYRKENGTTVNEWVRSPQLPNTSGATGRLVVVVTVPSDAVAMSVRAMNGCDGGQAVLVDSVTIEPASTDGSWFEQSLPTANTFPNDSPATLKSTNDKFEVKGDGSGHWGPLTFGADGSMTGIPKTAAGTLDVSAPSGGGTTNVWVTFPTGRFATTPTITTSLRSSAPNSASVSTGGATSAGFYLYFYRVNDNKTGVNWIAMGEG